MSLQSLTDTVDRVSGAVERLSAKVDRTAESVAALLAIAEIHDRKIETLKDSQAETGERLNALINTVGRLCLTGRSEQFPFVQGAVPRHLPPYSEYV